MSTGRRLTWFFLALGLLLLGAHLYAALAPPHSLLNWFPTDDAFFYFKVAQNIAEGRGSTFDGFGLTNGYHPLWLLVCVPVFWLARYDLYLPLRVLVLLLGLLQWGSAWLLFRWLRAGLRLPAALLGSAFWALYPYLHTLTARNGLETGLSAFFLLAVLAYLSRPGFSLWRAGLLAALAFLSRLDNIFLLSLLGLWLALPPQRRKPVFAWLLLLPLSLATAYFWRLGPSQFYEYTRTVQWTLALALILKLPLLNLGAGRGWRGLLAANAIGSGLLGGALALLFAAGRLPMWSRSVLLADWTLTSLGLLALSRWPGPSTLSWPSRAEVRQTLQRAAAYFTPLLLTLAGYLALNLRLFGTAMPVSGQIKAWWGTLTTIYGRPPQRLTAVLGLAGQTRKQPFYLLQTLLPFEASIPLLLGLLALLLLLRYRRSDRPGRLLLLPLLVGSAFHIWAYTLRPYAGLRAWYWVAEMLLLTAALALLFDGLPLRPRPQALAAALLGFGLVVSFLRSATGRITYRPDYVNQDFFAPVEFLTQQTEKGATIGLTGGGYLAYLLPDRTIVNLDGLINSPHYAALLQSRQADRYLEEIGLQYVFGREKMLTQTQPYQWFLPDHLQPVGELDRYTLYRYLP